MSDDFYTNVRSYGNSILYRGIKDGKRFQKKIPYKPTLFVPTTEQSIHKTIYNENLKPIQHDSIKAAKDFIKKYEDIENFQVYGNISFEYCAISDIFPNEISWDLNKVRIAMFDIEVNSDPNEGGFASTDDPFQPIISIAYKLLNDDITYVFGYHDFSAPNIKYIKCPDEYNLIKKFIDFWSLEYPDIISAWNANFDISYCVNRFNRIVGEEETKRLSPWNVIQERKTRIFNNATKRYQESSEYKILGISIIDYLELYKKYQPGGNSKESYKLGDICEEEVKETKVEFDGSLHRLYIEDKHTFYLYNAKDVQLIEKLDSKCKLFFLILTMAYASKTNPEDVLMQTRMWDVLIYNHLKKKNIQIPPKKKADDTGYEGAFVKPPIPGIYKWIISLDATSLYPTTIQSLNCSPETIIPPEQYTKEMRDVLSKGISVEKLLKEELDLSTLNEQNVVLAANGQFFMRDKLGFIPEMVDLFFTKRQEYKKEKLRLQSEQQILIAELASRGL